MPETIMEFQARAARQIDAHDQAVKAPLLSDLRRAKALIGRLRAEKAVLRDRLSACDSAITQEYKRNRGGKAWYAVALIRSRIHAIINP